jgi:DNA-binding MarR family transcriptional regulator
MLDFSQLLEAAAVSLIISRSVWELSNVQGTRRLVLLCLADHANDQGTSWPCIATIAKECRLGRRGVQKILRKLVAAGAITVEQLGGGKSKATRYRVTANGGSLFGKLKKSQTANGGTQTANSGSPEPLTLGSPELKTSGPLDGLSRSERHKATEIRCRIPKHKPDPDPTAL